MLTALAVMTAAISCKKSDDAGTTPTPNPTPKDTTKIVSLDTVTGIKLLPVGQNGLIGTFTYTVKDTALTPTISAVHVYSSIAKLSNVKAVFTGPISLTAQCSYLSGNSAFGTEYGALPFGKSTKAGIYTIGVYATANDDTSTVITLQLDIRVGTKTFSLTVSNSPIAFVSGGVFLQKDINTPKTQSVLGGQSIEGLKLSLGAVGMNYSPNYIEVTAAGGALATSAEVKTSGGVSMGMANFVNGIAKISLANLTVFDGTTATMSVFVQLASFTGQATGQYVTVSSQNITYIDGFGSTTAPDATTYTGNPLYVYNAFLSFKNNPVNQTVSMSGNDLFSFDVDATGGTVGENQMSFSVLWGKAPTSTDTLASVIRFFEGTNDITSQVNITNQSGDTIAGNKITPSTSVITVTWKTGESVITSSKRYTIKGICTGFKNPGSYVQVSLLTDAGMPQVVGKIDYSGNFKISVNNIAAYNIWTDRSHPAHTSVKGAGSTPDHMNTANTKNETSACTTGL